MLTLFIWNVFKTGVVCIVLITLIAGLAGRMKDWFKFLGLHPDKD